MDTLLGQNNDVLNYLLDNFCTTSSRFCMRFVNVELNKICGKDVGVELRKSFLKENNLDYYTFYIDLCSNYVRNERLYAECGSLEVLSRAWSKNVCDGVELMIAACKEGHLHILKWLQSQGVVLTEIICYTAAGYNQPDVFGWALSSLSKVVPHRITWMKIVGIKVATQSGHAGMAKWIEELAV